MSTGLIMALLGGVVWVDVACLMLAGVLSYAGLAAFSRKVSLLDSVS